MRMTPLEPHPSDGSEKRRWIWIMVAAVLVPLALMVVLPPIVKAGGMEWGFVLIGVVFAAAGVSAHLRNRRTREGTDERARELHRRAASFSWQVTAAVLAGTLVWMQIRHGVRATQPYLHLLEVVLGSYVAASLWHRWRSF